MLVGVSNTAQFIYLTFQSIFCIWFVQLTFEYCVEVETPSAVLQLNYHCKFVWLEFEYELDCSGAAAQIHFNDALNVGANFQASGCSQAPCYGKALQQLSGLCHHI